MRHYEAIEARAAELGLPRFYRADLTEHDRAALEARDPAESFGWIVYECGTHLVYEASICAMIGEIFRGLHCHFWNGRRLETVSSPELLALRMEEAT